MIDLRRTIGEVRRFVLDGVNKFVNENGNPKSIGIYSHPGYGWITLNFNLSSSFDDKDMNCPDFEFVEYSIMEFEEWEREYEQASMEIVNHLGIKIELGTLPADEDFKKPFYKMLEFAISEIAHKINSDEILIQLMDSQYVKKIK